MTEEPPRYKMKKVIDGNTIKYRKMAITAEDLLEERDNEIVQLKKLVDDLRSKIETLEQEQQRCRLVDNKEAGPVESYNCYF